MARRKKAAVVVPDTTVLRDPCEACGGVECGTYRVPVCCGSCTH
jgi:hypothetical protein